MGNLDLIWNLAFAVGVWCLLYFGAGLVDGHRKARARRDGSARIARERLGWCKVEDARCVKEAQQVREWVAYLLQLPPPERIGRVLGCFLCNPWASAEEVDREREVVDRILTRVAPAQGYWVPAVMNRHGDVIRYRYRWVTA